jgi:hypothetical protein
MSIVDILYPIHAWYNTWRAQLFRRTHSHNEELSTYIMCVCNRVIHAIFLKQTSEILRVVNETVTL